MTETKNPRDSRVISIDQVFANDLNNYNTLFGGVLMKRIDNVASLAARRHARVRECVTASIDSIDFLHPITQSESVCIEAFVSSTGNKSMEVFCKVITEDMITEDRKVAATAFLTFVALDDSKRPIKYPVLHRKRMRRNTFTNPARKERRCAEKDACTARSSHRRSVSTNHGISRRKEWFSCMPTRKQYAECSMSWTI